MDGLPTGADLFHDATGVVDFGDIPSPESSILDFDPTPSDEYANVDFAFLDQFINVGDASFDNNNAANPLVSDELQDLAPQDPSQAAHLQPSAGASASGCDALGTAVAAR